MPFEAAVLAVDRGRALHAMGRRDAAVEQAHRACAALRRHVATIFTKLDVASRTAAVAHALGHKLV